MKSLSNIAICLILCKATVNLVLGEIPMTIEDKSGREIKITLSGGNDRMISFTKNGEWFEFPIDSLSAQSQELVRAQLAKMNAIKIRNEALFDLDPVTEVGANWQVAQLVDLHSKGKKVIMQERLNEYKSLEAINGSFNHRVHFSTFHKWHTELINTIGWYAVGEKISEERKLDATKTANHMANSYKSATIRKIAIPNILPIAAGNNFNMNQSRVLAEIYYGPVLDAYVNDTLVSHAELWSKIQECVEQIKAVSQHRYTKLDKGVLGSNPNQFSKNYDTTDNKSRSHTNLLESYKSKVDEPSKIESKSYIVEGTEIEVYFYDKCAFAIIYTDKSVSGISEDFKQNVLDQNGVYWAEDKKNSNEVQRALKARYCGNSCLIFPKQIMLADEYLMAAIGLNK